MYYLSTYFYLPLPWPCSKKRKNDVSENARIFCSLRYNWHKHLGDAPAGGCSIRSHQRLVEGIAYGLSVAAIMYPLSWIINVCVCTRLYFDMEPAMKIPCDHLSNSRNKLNLNNCWFMDGETLPQIILYFYVHYRCITTHWRHVLNIIGEDWNFQDLYRPRDTHNRTC